MASSSQWKDIDDKFCLCSICLQQLKEPKLLPCLHRYCKDCLTAIIQCFHANGAFKCPECREEIQIPRNGVDGFKTDFYMKNLVEYVQIQQSLRSDEIRECCGCSKHVRVAAYCFKCNDFLCKDCYNFHVTSKMLKDHQKHTLGNTDAKSITIEKLDSMREAPRCHTHSENIAQICCETCGNLPVCITCVYGKHKEHNLHEVKTLAALRRKELARTMEALLDIEKDKKLMSLRQAKEKLISNVSIEKEKVMKLHDDKDQKLMKRRKDIEDRRQQVKQEAQNTETKIFDSLKREMESELREVKKKYEEIFKVKKIEINSTFQAQESSLVEELVCQSFLERKGTITKTGGIVEIPNTGVILAVPPNALPEHMEKCEMHIRIIPRKTLKEQVASFSSNSTTVVELLPDGLSFQRSVRLSLPHCLVLQQSRERKARIFVSHHEKGRPPNWKEHTNLSYHLEDTSCIIFLDGFCWVKYSVNDEIVEAKKLVVYTAARKLQPQDRVAEVHVGYYLDLPDEQEILRETRDLIVAHRKTLLFLKRKEKSKYPLQVVLNNVFPREWQCFESPSREITYTKIERDERDPLLYKLQTDASRPGNPLCVFTVSQRSCHVAIQLAVHLRVTDKGPLPTRIVHSRTFMEQCEAPLKAEMTIDKTGGTLKIANSNVELEIPANALPPHMDECIIWMRIIPSRIVEDQVNSLCSNSSTAVELYPSKLTLQRPAKLILPHCLQFEENAQPTARIFTNNGIGCPSYWKETQAIEYDLKESACIVYLQTFLCVKYSVDDKDVRGTKIRLYTAAKKIKQNDNVAHVEVGYYSDIPVGQELLRLNPNLVVDSRRTLLFMKQEKVSLQLSLDSILPPQWTCLSQKEGPQEIPGKIIASSIEHSHLYILQKGDDQCGSVMCHFKATQGRHPTPVQISIRLCPEEDRTEGSLQMEQMHPMLVTFEFLSEELSSDWVDVGRALGIKDCRLKQLRADNPCRMKDAIYQMLLQWKQANGTQASYDVLLHALHKAGREDLVDSVQNREEFS